MVGVYRWCGWCGSAVCESYIVGDIHVGPAVQQQLQRRSLARPSSQGDRRKTDLHIHTTTGDTQIIIQCDKCDEIIVKHVCEIKVQKKYN